MEAEELLKLEAYALERQVELAKELHEIRLFLSELDKLKVVQIKKEAE